MKKPPAADPESCASCKCFQANSTDEYGYCRRRPPCVISSEMGPISIQPSTASNEWCAEFIRKLND